MHDDRDPYRDEGFQAARERFHARAERRAERWARRRERRAERREMRHAYGGAGSYLWGPPDHGPSPLTLRLQRMMRQVEEITDRVGLLEKLTVGSDARLAREIDRLSRNGRPGA
jgi:hypothetical protein